MVLEARFSSEEGGESFFDESSSELVTSAIDHILGFRFGDSALSIINGIGDSWSFFGVCKSSDPTDPDPPEGVGDAK